MLLMTDDEDRSDDNTSHDPLGELIIKHFFPYLFLYRTTTFFKGRGSMVGERVGD